MKGLVYLMLLAFPLSTWSVAISADEVRIVNCEVSLKSLSIDEIEISKIEVEFTDPLARLVTIAIDGCLYEESVVGGRATVNCSWTECIIKRAAGQGTLLVDVAALDSQRSVLSQRVFEVDIPTIRIGQTAGAIDGQIAMKLLWVRESPITVNGPYISGYYTFAARPGMKFVILAFEFMNNGIRPTTTPYLNTGELRTTQGYIYPLWSPRAGARSDEYSPTESTPGEIEELIGNSGGYESLLPEETVLGQITFEIPLDEDPVEMQVDGIAPIISLGEVPATRQIVEEELTLFLENLLLRFPYLSGHTLSSLFKKILEDLTAQ